MPFEPIQQLDIENYGCIKKASFKLTPLHALIGPNDSGKSTVLRALRTVAQFAAGDFGADPNNHPEPFDPKLDASANRTSLTISYSDASAYNLQREPESADVYERLRLGGTDFPEAPGPRAWNTPGILKRKPKPQNERWFRDCFDRLQSHITVATLIRFDPDSLRAPARLIPDSHGIAFGDERGTGLASVFDAIINRDASAFATIQANTSKLFPSVTKIGLINVSDSKKKIAATLVDDTRVGAESMSEGLLYYLGFAALKFIQGSRIFLVEEPENGLHPARISEVMAILREISRTNQVIIATHSPLVVNELRGEEISVITRDPEKGTEVKLLKDVPGFEEAMKVYQPGEFWVSYCDGNQEKPLLTGSPRP